MTTSPSHAVSVFAARRRECFGFPTGPRLLLPEGDHAGETPPGTTPPEGATPPATPPADTGFPANTPVVEMSPEQQVAYWKHQSRKHEGRAAERGDYDALKAKAEQFDAAQREAMTEHERALAEARDAAKAEGRLEALSEANRGAVTALINGALQVRGRNADQIAALLKHFNPDSLVKDGAPDTVAIVALADDIAGPVTGGGHGRGPDFGQGHRGPGTKATGIDAGRAMFAARRGGK